MAQGNGYLNNRVKPGDIFYINGMGEERFIDYRQWNPENPQGDPQGVVVYSYYGPLVYDPSSPPAWHGWIVDAQGMDPCIWAPTNSVCSTNTVAKYAASVVTTPFNPAESSKQVAVCDSCGWQNTYRLLEFVYEGQGKTLTENVSPAFYYIFAQKNGIADLSTKPTMNYTTWYMPGFGQLRVMFGTIGCLNAALNACGGNLLMGQTWFSSTEPYRPSSAVWSIEETGVSCDNLTWSKDTERSVRAFRNF